MGLQILIFALAVCYLPFSNGYRTFERCDGTPWIKFQSNCYLFETSYKTRISYHDAEDFCRSQGAHLVSIHSAEENEFLLNTASEGGFGGRFWIGLTTFTGNNTPEWSDGSVVDFQKRVYKEYYVNEKCFMLMWSKRGWRPEHCSLHYAPICKRNENAAVITIPPPTTPEPQQGYCPEGWIQFENKCYKYFGASEEERKQFKQARDACWALGEGHDLVSIHSREEQAFLTQHLHDLGTSAWIGMRQITSDEIGHDLVFGWIDNSRTDFTFWAKGHPPPGTWKYCARLDFEGVAKGQWIADYCEIDKKGYVCQRSADPSAPVPVPEPSKCDAESVGYRKSCYRYMADPESQENAEKTCQKFGGHLVSIEDGFEQEFLFNFIGSKSNAVWNGLKTVQGTSYLRWADKKPFYYSNFADGKPVLFPTKESCFVLDVKNELKWNITECSAKLPYVCKFTDEISPSIPEVIGGCPSTESSWIDIGDEFCYHVASSPNHILSWDAVSRYCLTKGMKMTKAYSEHQLKSLVTYFWTESYPIHLGLIRSFDKQSFIWTDSSTFDFTNWEEREPGTYTKGKDCVAFHQSSGKWKSINCGDGGVTVCQLPKFKMHS